MDNLNTITYADDWKKISDPIYKADTVDNINNVDKTEVIERKSKLNFPLLLLIQLIICSILVLSAYVLKITNSQLYRDIHNWYHEAINNEIIMKNDFTSFHMDEIFAGEVSD